MFCVIVLVVLVLFVALLLLSRAVVFAVIVVTDRRQAERQRQAERKDAEACRSKTASPKVPGPSSCSAVPASSSSSAVPAPSSCSASTGLPVFEQVPQDEEELRAMVQQAQDNIDNWKKQQLERLQAIPIAPPPTGSPVQDPPTGSPVQPRSSATEPVLELPALDRALAHAIAHGWPKWLTPGSGDQWPSSPVHDFEHHCLRESARIDFKRGKASDDRPNAIWGQFWNACHQYRCYMCRRYNPSSENTIGNAMETAIGISYAAATCGRFLGKSSLLWTKPDQQEAWAALWWVWQDLGFTPHLNRSQQDPRNVSQDPFQPYTLEGKVCGEWN